MRRAKDTGGGCVALFDPEWDPEASQRLVIHHELRSALGSGGGGLHLHYQPRLSLPSLRLTGAEALLRWDHAELGRLSPSAVVAVAEESGLMPQLGMWVLDAACAQIRAWDSLADARPPRVAVNVAAQQLLNDDLADDVNRVLRRWKLPGDVLELEITETAAIQNLRRSVALLTEIRSMGVSIALDDFGTGYSSLAHLRRLPLDTVKIDQSFIRELPRDESNQAVVTAIIELAHRLGLTVVAEGVEMQSQLDHLIRGGCDEAQGWLFAPALPADEFVRRHCSATPSAGSS
jgi:EAL domain-containing protein (putative c-di-GMP-specific phosphodiesterase class I)